MACLQSASLSTGTVAGGLDQVAATFPPRSRSETAHGHLCILTDVLGLPAVSQDRLVSLSSSAGPVTRRMPQLQPCPPFPHPSIRSPVMIWALALPAESHTGLGMEEAVKGLHGAGCHQLQKGVELVEPTAETKSSLGSSTSHSSWWVAGETWAP